MQNKLDISNIKPGMVFKNYKELCHSLGIKPAEGGRNKKDQEKIISSYIEYKKSTGSHKVIIIKIKEIPDIIIDHRKFGNNSKYCHIVVKLLLNHIYSTDNSTYENGYKEIALSKKEIMIIICLCNHNYRDKRQEIKFIDNQIVTRLDCFLFYQRHSIKSKEIILPALNQLKNYATNLVYRKAYLIKADEMNPPKITTKEEYEKINIYKEEVLKLMDMKNMREVYLKNQQDKFYETLNNILKNTEGWETIKELYLLTVPELSPRKIQSFKLNEVDKESLEVSLNKLIVDFLLKDAEKKFNESPYDTFKKNQNLNEYNYDLTKIEAYSKILKDFVKLPEDYIEKQSFLTLSLIKL